MNSVITLGPITIHYYSIFILLGILIGGRLAIYEGEKRNIPKDFMFNLIFLTFFFGIIGARLYYAVFNLEYYQNNPLELYMIWKGGLAIHGGIIAGVITIIAYSSKYKCKPFRSLDIITVSLLLAQAIGRWGNFFNSEAHGPETTLAHLQNLHLPNFIINGMNINGTYYEPTFLYESLLCLIGFIILMVFRSRKTTKLGQTTGLYLIYYGIIRFFVEGLRTDSLMLVDIKMAQVMSIIMVITGIIIFIVKRKDISYHDPQYYENINF